MNLTETVQATIELTASLQRALEGDDLDTWQDLLDQRAELLANLDGLYRAATETDRTAIRIGLDHLAQADRDLCLVADDQLTKSAALARSGLGSIGPAAGSYDRAPLQACVDSRA